MKALIFILTALVTVSMCAAQIPNRGDFNGDGSYGWSAGDAIYLFSYLFDGGPPPPSPMYDSLDLDCHHQLTISDANISWQCIFTCDIPPECVVIHPPLDPDIDPDAKLHHTNRMPADASCGLVRLGLTFSFYYEAFALPFALRVDGQIPTIDSVIFPAGFNPDVHRFFIDEADGEIALGAIRWFGFGPLNMPIAEVYFSIPPSSSERPVTVEWTIMDPIQEPNPEGSIFPMLTHTGGYDYEPVLDPICCITPGDVNDDGEVNVGDAVYMIGYVFLYGPPPPCPGQADANCDGHGNVSDAVYLINYIFKGGPPPCPICW
jgi:hypothetical protein